MADILGSIMGDRLFPAKSCRLDEWWVTAFSQDERRQAGYLQGGYRDAGRVRCAVEVRLELTSLVGGRGCWELGSRRSFSHGPKSLLLREPQVVVHDRGEVSFAARWAARGPSPVTVTCFLEHADALLR